MEEVVGSIPTRSTNFPPEFSHLHRLRNQLHFGAGVRSSRVRSGTLPSVVWITPNSRDSEHPPSRIRVGKSCVTHLINAAMENAEWDSMAMFLAWDDRGGFYDHVTHRE